MATLTPAQREAAQLHAAVLEAASTNMREIASRWNPRDAVVADVDPKIMLNMAAAALITSMAYRRAISGSLEIEA